MRRSTTTMAAPLACLLTLVIAGQALATTTWSSHVTLATYGSITGNRPVATLGTGTIVVAYSTFADPPGVFVRRSTDSGATWEAPLQLSSADAFADAAPPEISAHGTNVDVVWLANGHVRYARSIDSAVSFLPTLTLGAVPASTDYHHDTVRVGRGPNGRVVVAWEACTAGKSVRARVSIDGGASFGVVHPLVADCGTYGHGVNVAVGTGAIYISYRDYVPAYHHPTRLQIVRSLDDGTTWKAPVTLADDTRGGFGTDIAAEGADAYITYVISGSDGHRGWAHYSRTTDRGATWTAAAYLAPPSGPDSSSPVVSLDDGVVRVAYNGPGVSYRESVDGIAWTAPQTVAPGNVGVAGIGFAGRIMVLYTKSGPCSPDECDGWDLRLRTRTP